MNDRNLLEKIIFYSGIIGIFFLPFSLSLTQGFLYLSCAVLMVYLMFTKKSFFDKESFKIFLFFFIFYLWIYVANFLNSKFSFESIKDFFLIFYGIWSYYFVQTKYKEKLLKYLKIVFFLFLTIGIISSFLPFRLSNLFYHLQHGFYFDAKYRAQHLLFAFPFGSWNFSNIILPFGIYMPVGFTGTHLSFGSMISLISLFFLYGFLKVPSLKNFIFLSPFLMILILSHARSAMFGFLITLIFLFSILRFKNQIFSKKILIFIFFFIIVLIIYSFLPERIKEILPALKKHTDYQRVFLWYLCIEVFLKNPLVGVGTLNFSDSIFQEILSTVQKKPLLWYPLYQIEIMHGHNDLIFFAVGSGIPGIILFFSIFYQKFRWINFIFPKIKMMRNDNNFFLVFLFIPVYLLFAGMFQCFFLDDYTMQMYWLLYGIGLGIAKTYLIK